jgi:putative tryptophan/tyrosine transport system substrate-binding protein
MERHQSRWSRRAFVGGSTVSSLGLLAGCGRLPWQAQDAPKVHRIGFLSLYTTPTYYEAFQQGLREQGLVEGKNLVIEYRSPSAPDQGRLAELATELVQMPVDLLVADGTQESLVAKNTTSAIPIVFVPVGDPVGAGLVASLARPGGNATGISGLAPAMTGKRLELLKIALPTVTRVGVLRETNNPNHGLIWSQLRDAAPALGVELQSVEVDQHDGLMTALQATTERHVEALYVPASSLFNSEKERILDFVAQNRLPSMYNLRQYVDAGGLMSYGQKNTDLYRRAAYYVDRILKGTKPADLPVEQPMTFDFVVNLKTAQALGITFPNEIMLQVTEVIQ